MVSRTREAWQYRESRDPKVAAAGIQVRTGRKWSAGKSLEVAESRLRQKALVGPIATGRAGFGYFPVTRVDNAQGKERRGSLEHLLSSCPKALGDGRYRWRHDQVLKAVAESIATAINTIKGHHNPRSIKFLRAGEKALPQPRAKSDSTKQLILLELTVPWEERMDEANERKRAKYQELVEECRRQGWQTRCEPLEVGCRGFAGRSLCYVFKTLGITGEAKRKAIRSATEAAEKATRWLWIKRAEPWAIAAGTQAGV
ncbi:hypothetical protein PO909_002121 [Leuciscus waleckii]